MLYFKKGKNTAEIEQNSAVYGEGAVSDQTCQKWFAKFRAGDSRWTMLHGQVEHLTWIVIKSRH